MLPARPGDNARRHGPAGRRAPDVVDRPPGALVGRRFELDELDAALAEALAGRGGLHLVVGEPGVGKTRLAEELSGHAQAAGADVFWGRCWEGGGAPAYWPWVQVVRSYVRRRDLDSFAEDLGGGGAHLAHIVPELRDEIPGLPPAPAVEPENLRFGLFDAVSRLLHAAAVRQPVVVVLDDLHAADPPSLLLLQFVARELRGSRVLLLGSYRDVEPGLDPEVGALLAGLARHGRRTHLRGLTSDEVVTLMSGAGSGSPHPSLAGAIHRLTDGNPFFVDEVVRLLRAEGRFEQIHLAGDPLGIPGRVRDAIAQRVGLLSADTREVLVVAAVVVRDFDARVVERTAGLAVDEVSSALDEAIAAGLVVEALRAARRYSFRHALVRETLYEALPAARRARLHQDVGEALEHLIGDRVESHAAELAHHFFEAATVGGAAKALELSQRAGDLARQMLAYEEGRGHYERALQSMSLAGVSDDLRRCEVLLRRAECEWGAGESATARATFLEAAAIARRTRAPELLARAAIGYARGLSGFLHVVRADETIIGLIEEALLALEDRDSELRARLLARLAVELYYTDRVERRIALSSEAIEMARRLDDPASLLVALYSRHWAACGPETLDERLANATEMVQLAREVGDTERTFLGHNVRVTCLLELCDAEPVDREIQAMLALAEEVRQPFYRWRTTCLRATRTILDARFDEGERLADEAFEIGRASDPEMATVVRGDAHTFALRFGQGRLAELEPAILDFSRRYPWIQPWRLPLLYAELGRDAEARAEVERQAVRDFADFPRDALWITRVAALAYACARGGDASRARQLYELLLPFADRNVSTIADQSYGPVATALGVLAAVMERWGDAEEHFRVALDHCRKLSAPTFTAAVLSEHARMLLGRAGDGDRERALSLLGDAEVLCSRHGINGVLERVLADRVRAQEPGESDCQFRLAGDYWTISFSGDVFRMKDGKGLRYLAQLLANPGAELHALDMVATTRPPADVERSDLAVAAAAQAGLRVSRLEGAGAALDAQAKQAYRRRLADLDIEVEQAHEFNDPERAVLLEQERTALIRELAAAVGLGGRDRPQASPSERARVNVTRSIRSSIERIAASSPALAGHLNETIRTGSCCAYLPGPDGRPAWRL